MSDFFPPDTSTGQIGVDFTIGISPIGTITPFNWQDTVVSQYGNSPRLLQLIENINGYLDQSQNIDLFFDNMWNIDTAQGYGLDVWGRIIGIGRALAVDADTYFGFSEAADVDIVGFNQEPFYAGPPTTSNYLLTDDAYRLLLLAKAAANICDGSIPAMNRILMSLFPLRGNAYVQEGAGVDEDYFGFDEAGPGNVGFDQEPFYSGQTFAMMSMRYVFDFALTAVEQAIVSQSGVLPTPTGVTATIEINP